LTSPVDRLEVVQLVLELLEPIGVKNDFFCRFNKRLPVFVSRGSRAPADDASAPERQRKPDDCGAAMKPLVTASSRANPMPGSRSARSRRPRQHRPGPANGSLRSEKGTRKAPHREEQSPKTTTFPQGPHRTRHSPVGERPASARRPPIPRDEHGLAAAARMRPSSASQHAGEHATSRPIRVDAALSRSSVVCIRAGETRTVTASTGATDRRAGHDVASGRLVRGETGCAPTLVKRRSRRADGGRQHEPARPPHGNRRRASDSWGRRETSPSIIQRRRPLHDSPPH